jgi:hypothetical protein
VSILQLWIKRGAIGAATSGGTTLLTEVVTDAGEYVVTDNDETVVLG